MVGIRAGAYVGGVGASQLAGTSRWMHTLEWRWYIGSKSNRQKLEVNNRTGGRGVEG